MPNTDHQYPPAVAPNTWDETDDTTVQPPMPPNRAFDISGDAGNLAEAQPRTIVQQPGTMSGVPQQPQPLGVKWDKSIIDGINTRDQGSDKYATLKHMVDGAQAYQILPPDPYRKRATIIVPIAAIGAFVLIGSQPVVDSGDGFPVYGQNNGATAYSFVYTGRAPLYAKAQTVGTFLQVNTFVERFGDGMPIN